MTDLVLSSEHGALPLAPIDRPQGWFVRVLYRVFARRYGITPTGFRVLYARSPFIALVSLVIITGLLRALKLERELAELVQLSVATRNGCTFCVDLHMTELVRARLGGARFRDLLEFEQSPAFTAREKAALRYVQALHESLHIPDPVWAGLRAEFSERECVDLVWICAVERYYNAMALPLRIGSDQLALRLQRASEAQPRA